VTQRLKKQPPNGADAAPHSLGAEQAVLGSLLLESTRLPEVAELLGPGYFYRTDHRTIFAAITALDSQGKPSDPVTVAAHLERAGQLAEVGGLAYLSQLARDTPSAAHVRTYAETVCEHARRRQLGDLSADIARSLDGNSTVAEILPRVRSHLELVEHAGPSARPERRPLDWKALSGRSPPARDWAVDHWLAQGHVALLAGAPGVGKTLLAQTLGTCLALGSEYIDLIPRPRRVLIWGGEDEDAELWRRQLDICRCLNVGTEALAGQLIVESYLSRDITLAGLGFGRLVTTPMMTELREQIGDYKADYVFLDSLARVYGGNENDRHQVTQFVSELAHACAPTVAGLCLLGHPGKATGSEYSGSTAWEGSVRSRLYLGHRLPDQHPDEDEQAPAEDTVRYVCRRKSNYSAKDWRKLTYEGGVLVPEARAPQRIGQPAGEFGQDVVLRAVRKLADLRMHGNTAPNSPDYLPRLAKQYRMLEELSERQFATHMRELILAKRLATQTVGQYSNRTPRPGLVEVHQ
jgi:hypothetical protein